MATHYVDSNAAGANDGTSWTDAWASIVSAVGVAASDTVLVASNHAETFGGSQILTFANSTIGAPVRIISTNSGTGAYAKGATITGSSSDMEMKGHMRIHGVIWQPNRTFIIGSSASTLQIYDDCEFNPQTVAVPFGSPAILLEGSSLYGRVVAFFNSCSFDFSIPGDDDERRIEVRDADAQFVDCLFTGAATNTAVFEFSATPNRSVIDVLDSDISDYDHLSLPPAVSVYDRGHGGRVSIHRSKVKSGFTLFSAALQGATEGIASYCDDGTITATPIGLTEKANYYGTAKHTLSVYRTGGADDGENANAYSVEMIANASAAEIYSAIDVQVGARWIDSDASPSGATARPIVTSTRCDPLATPTALTTDSGSTWNGTGVGTKQKISHTLNNGDTLTVYVASGGTLNNDDFWIEVSEPDQVGGLVVVKAFLAKPSTTVYVDPKLDIA